MPLPKIVVKKMDFDLNVRLMCRYVNPAFCKRNKTRPFAERSYQLYPELRDKIHDGISDAEIFYAVRPSVQRVYSEKAHEMDEKIQQLQNEFDKIQEPLMKAMTELFHMEWPDDQPQFTCYVGCISSFPRDVMTKEFFVSYEKEIDMLLMASIHEMNHFVFFEKWKQMHGYNSEREPLFPDALWFLEEMMVDPTLNVPSIQKIAPYEQIAYDLFYERKVDGISFEEHLKDMFEHRASIEEFIDQAYEFVKKNHDALL